MNSDSRRACRRAFLGRAATGLLGSVAWQWLAARESQRAAAGEPRGAAVGPHHRPKVERVICLFQNGGPSQMDLFDPKPELTKRNGQPYPGKQKVETLSPSA